MYLKSNDKLSKCFPEQLQKYQNNGILIDKTTATKFLVNLIIISFLKCPVDYIDDTCKGKYIIMLNFP